MAGAGVREEVDWVEGAAEEGAGGERGWVGEVVGFGVGGGVGGDGG